MNGPSTLQGAGRDADVERGHARQMHYAADGRVKMFLGERWPDNGDACVPTPAFFDHRGWEDIARGRATPPRLTVHREAPSARNDRNGNEGGIVVRAAPLRHPVPCFGYVVDEPDQPGRMDVERATALGLPPGPLYKKLKNGEPVTTADGVTIRPEDVLGPTRPGRRLCLLGDTCDSVAIAELARGADVLVHESTFAAFKRDEALYKGHSTSAMAGAFARLIRARNLLLTHFSNRYGASGVASGAVRGLDDVANDVDDDVDDDMALPETPPEDMSALAKEESTAVDGLVREAAHAKGDDRVVAASDFFAFNVQRREGMDEIDLAKGCRDALFSGPSVAPVAEEYHVARRRMERGGIGFVGGGDFGDRPDRSSSFERERAHDGGAGHGPGPGSGPGGGRGRGSAPGGSYGGGRGGGGGGRGGGGGGGERGERRPLRRRADGSFERGGGERRGVEGGRVEQQRQRRPSSYGSGEVQGGPLRGGNGATIDSTDVMRDFSNRRR